MLGLCLRVRDLGGEADRAQFAFEQAATALESVIAKGDPADPERDFHHVMAATAYHLGIFRRAYSLLAPVQADHNFSPLERALCHLIPRNLSELEQLALTSRLGGDGYDKGCAPDENSCRRHIRGRDFAGRKTRPGGAGV
jgi:hypothetical protein